MNSVPICLTAKTSGTINQPTISAPMLSKKLNSVLVSKLGPVRDANTPL